MSGTAWVQSDMAGLLRRLAADGPAAFYHGDIPRTIVRQVREHGGILSEDGLRRVCPSVVEPLAIDYRGYRVLTPPPPSGGLTSLQILRTLERFDLASLTPVGGGVFPPVRRSGEVGLAGPGAHLGDPDVTPVPIERLLSDETARGPGGADSPAAVSPDARGGANPPRSSHTVNILAADAAGNVVSMTATQGYLFGSTVVIDGLGLVMGHGMSRFDPAADSPNAAAAGKRMVHNMAPTVLLGRMGGHSAAVGLPGGPKIVTVTAQLVVEPDRLPRVAGRGGDRRSRPRRGRRADGCVVGGAGRGDRGVASDGSHGPPRPGRRRPAGRDRRHGQCAGDRPGTDEVGGVAGGYGCGRNDRRKICESDATRSTESSDAKGGASRWSRNRTCGRRAIATVYDLAQAAIDAGRGSRTSRRRDRSPATLEYDAVYECAFALAIAAAVRPPATSRRVPGHGDGPDAQGERGEPAVDALPAGRRERRRRSR